MLVKLMYNKINMVGVPNANALILAEWTKRVMDRKTQLQPITLRGHTFRLIFLKYLLFIVEGYVLLWNILTYFGDSMLILPTGITLDFLSMLVALVSNGLCQSIFNLLTPMMKRLIRN